VNATSQSLTALLADGVQPVSNPTVTTTLIKSGIADFISPFSGK